METKNNGFLQDKNGDFSSMRLAFFTLLIYGLTMGTYVTFKEGSVLGLAFISGIITLSGTLKLLQNQQEK
jgi:hypothetical protein